MLGDTYQDKAKVVHCMPDDAMKNEVFIASIFCAVIQLFISFLLLFYSVQAMRNDDGNIEFTYVSWQLQLVRFLCACILHFGFNNEVVTALSMMNYVSLHNNKF